MRSIPPLPAPLLTLVVPLVSIFLLLVLPIEAILVRALLALFTSLIVILLCGFLIPAIGNRVSRSSLLIHTGASFFFGLVSALFLALNNPIPWIVSWLVLCLLWTFLPEPSFHRGLEDNFGNLFN